MSDRQTDRRSLVVRQRCFITSTNLCRRGHQQSQRSLLGRRRLGTQPAVLRISERCQCAPVNCSVTAAALPHNVCHTVRVCHRQFRSGSSVRVWDLEWSARPHSVEEGTPNCVVTPLAFPRKQDAVPTHNRSRSPLAFKTLLVGSLVPHQAASVASNWNTCSSAGMKSINEFTAMGPTSLQRPTVKSHAQSSTV